MSSKMQTPTPNTRAKAFIDQLPLFTEPADVAPRLKVHPAVHTAMRQLQATSDIATRAAVGGAHKGRAPRQRLTLDEAAEIFIKENPTVWQMFCRFTWEAYHAGRTKMGIALIFERMRWEQLVKTNSDDGFKLNNNHKAYFARRFMRENPEAGNLFTTRVTEKEKAEGPAASA